MYRLVISMTFTIICGCTSPSEKKTVEAPPATVRNENTVVLTDAQIKNAGIQTGRPVMHSMHSMLKVNGLVDVPPNNIVSISFPTGGYLKSMGLLPGMRISKGQVLAVMQDQSIIEMQENYLMAKVKLNLLQKEFDRQQVLNQSKATSDKQFEQVSSDLESVKISLKALKEKLFLIGINPGGLTDDNISRTVNIYAPISGFVSEVRVNVGRYVNPADILFDLVNTSDLHLALTVFEKDLPAVHPGQEIQCYLNGDSARRYDAVVMLVSRTLDSNRSAVVHCHFKDKNIRLFPGMFMNAEIALTNRQVIAVPEEAVVRSGDKNYIFIQHGDKQFQLLPVITGEAENGIIAVSSGQTDLLQAVIIIKNAYAVLMKMKNTEEE